MKLSKDSNRLNQLQLHPHESTMMSTGVSAISVDAMSAHRAVAVQETATAKDNISPR